MTKGNLVIGVLVGVLLVMGSLSSFGYSMLLAEPESAANTEFVDYHGATFTLRVPIRWEQATTPSYQAIFSAPKEQGFKVNVGVSIIKVLPDVTLEGVAQSAKEHQAKDYPNYTVINEQSLEIHDNPAFQRIYIWHSINYKTDFTQIQLFIMHKLTSTIYILTATSPNSLYAKYQDMLAEILNSFRVLD